MSKDAMLKMLKKGLKTEIIPGVPNLLIYAAFAYALGLVIFLVVSSNDNNSTTSVSNAGYVPFSITSGKIEQRIKIEEKNITYFTVQDLLELNLEITNGLGYPITPKELFLNFEGANNYPFNSYPFEGLVPIGSYETTPIAVNISDIGVGMSDIIYNPDPKISVLIVSVTGYDEEVSAVLDAHVSVVFESKPTNNSECRQYSLQEKIDEIINSDDIQLIDLEGNTIPKNESIGILSDSVVPSIITIYFDTKCNGQNIRLNQTSDKFSLIDRIKGHYDKKGYKFKTKKNWSKFDICFEATSPMGDIEEGCLKDLIVNVCKLLGIMGGVSIWVDDCTDFDFSKEKGLHIKKLCVKEPHSKNNQLKEEQVREHERKGVPKSKLKDTI